MIGKFFHTPKVRKFYIPYRYYDPQKEAMQERENRIRRELGLEEKKDWDPNYRPNIHGQFRRTMNSSKTAEDSKRRSATRLVLLIFILGLIFYFLIKF